MSGLVTLSVRLPVKLVTHLYATAIRENKRVSSIVGESLETQFDGELLEIVKSAPKSNNQPKQKEKAA